MGVFDSPAQEFTYVRTYSKWLEESKRREGYEESVDRFLDFITFHRPDIPHKVQRKIRRYMMSLDVMPSMRFFWSAGPAAERDNTCIYNCAFQAVNSIQAFSECLFTLMCGTGYGFSVEDRHVSKLPVVPAITGKSRNEYVVEDSREGWAKSVECLLQSLWTGDDLPMNYNGLRGKGARLKTMGGRSSGPEPLMLLHNFVRETLAGAQGRKLSSLECHDILNQEAEVTVCGGVRRSSQVSLSDLDDAAMASAKEWPFPPRRAMANNSAVYFERPAAARFLTEWAGLANSGTGERGIFNLGGARMFGPSRRNLGKIEGSNPCKPLNSLILTTSGYITFEQALSRPSLEVVTEDGPKKATTPFLSKQKAVVQRFTLSNGRYLYGTGNHLHRNDSKEWTPLDNLQVGDRLHLADTKVYADFQIEDNQRYEAGLVAGYVWADGSLGIRSDSPGHNFQVAFGVNEFDVIPFFERILDCKSRAHTQKPDTCRYISSHRKAHANILLEEGYNLNKGDLTWLFGKDKDYKIGFIRSAFTADGSVRKGNSVDLYSIHRESLEVLGSILSEFGVRTTVSTHNKPRSYIAKDGKRRNNKATYKLCVLYGQFKKIGFLSSFKNSRLVEQEETEPYRRKDYVTITDINRNYSVEDVYDIEVFSEEHEFIDNDVVSHNCMEILLRNRGFCNLSEVVIRADDDLDTLLDKAETAAWLGAIQATFTKFPFLNKQWARNCNEERLLGVSLTGQYDNFALSNDPTALAALKKKVLKVAAHASKKLGINMPAAATCGKPSGTVSQLVNCASGSHTRHSEYHIRWYRIADTDPLYRMMRSQGVKFYPEVGQTEQNASTWVCGFPIKCPAKSVYRDEVSAIDQLKHYLVVQKNWCEHNQSCTIYVKPEEWFAVGEMVYTNWDQINGVSFLPYDGGHYELAPYEEITKEKYTELMKDFPKIDYSELSRFETEEPDTNRGALACGGGSCEL